jgi:hypothetical protein
MATTSAWAVGVVRGGDTVPSTPNDFLISNDDRPKGTAFVRFHRFDGKANGFTQERRIHENSVFTSDEFILCRKR